MNSEFDEDFDEGGGPSNGPIRNKARTKKDQSVLREESKNRQKLLRAQMKELFRELAGVIRPPLDANHEKTKAILQRAIEYIQHCNQTIDSGQKVNYSPHPNSSPLSFAPSTDTSPHTTPLRDPDSSSSQGLRDYDLYLNPGTPQFYPNTFTDITDFNIQNLANADNSFFPFEEKGNDFMFDIAPRGIGGGGGDQPRGISVINQTSRGVNQIGTREIPQQQIQQNQPVNQYPQGQQYQRYPVPNTQQVPYNQPSCYGQPGVPPNYNYYPQLAPLYPPQPQNYGIQRTSPIPGPIPPIYPQNFIPVSVPPQMPKEKPLEESLKSLSVAERGIENDEEEEEVLDAILSLEETTEDQHVNTQQ